MKKLTTFLVCGAVLAVGLPGQAMAADIVTLQCSNYFKTEQGYEQSVLATQASAGVTLPVSCTLGQPSCPQCVADLLSNGFTLKDSFDVTHETLFGNAGPYFVLKR